VIDKRLFATLMHEAPPAVVLRMLADLSQKMRASNERRIQEQVAQHTLRSEMELERHRALSLMVAGVAHEINTPLGTTNTALSIIKRELTSPTFAALMQDRAVQQSIDDMLEAAVLMERNIQRAHKLTQDFKKISVSQLTDTKETMNLPEAVAEIVGLYTASAKRARLDIQIAHTLPPATQTWLGYRGYLSHILLNFLTNIERYAYQRGVGGTVAITLAEDGSRDVPVFVLTVRDFGQGIPPENVPQIFEPFFTTGRSMGGTGLGLSIVRNMVTGPLHGTVEVQSAVGQGTTFTVAFPQRIVDQPEG
jgi:signal transduction histidine kinase